MLNILTPISPCPVFHLLSNAVICSRSIQWCGHVAATHRFLAGMQRSELVFGSGSSFRQLPLCSIMLPSSSANAAGACRGATSILFILEKHATTSFRCCTWCVSPGGEDAGAGVAGGPGAGRSGAGGPGALTNFFKGLKPGGREGPCASLRRLCCRHRNAA